MHGGESLSDKAFEELICLPFAGETGTFGEVDSATAAEIKTVVISTSVKSYDLVWDSIGKGGGVEEHGVVLGDAVEHSL